MLSEYWAIRRKSDGLFLPQGSKKQHGYTHDEPEKNCVPRLFKKRSHANVALGHWLAGRTRVYYDFGGPDGDMDERWETQPIISRDEFDMEVVRVVVTVV